MVILQLIQCIKIQCIKIERIEDIEVTGTLFYAIVSDEKGPANRSYYTWFKSEEKAVQYIEKIRASGLDIDGLFIEECMFED